MDPRRLPEECKYENGLLKGPRKRTYWIKDGIVWEVWETKRLTSQRTEVTLFALTGPSTKRLQLTNGEFWNLVQNGEMHFLKITSGNEAILAGIDRH